MSTLPFTEKLIEETEDYIVVQRKFMSFLDENELTWHKDKEDREVNLLEGSGWYIQIDNNLPVTIKKDYVYKIPKETWHRIINKNKTNITLLVKKIKRKYNEDKRFNKRVETIHNRVFCSSSKINKITNKDK